VEDDQDSVRESSASEGPAEQAGDSCVPTNP